MNDWLAARGFWEMGGAVAGFSALLLVVLALALPSDRRGLLRRPAAVFAVYVALFGFAQVVPRHAEHSEWVRIGAFACALVVISRASLLLATETALGRWLLPPLPKIFQDVLQGALFVVVGLLTLRAAGFDPAQLLTTSAVLTAVVGLALQEPLGNLFSGLAIQVGRPFEVGDWIDIDADPRRSGRVAEIGWRATRVVTLDEVEVVVPNGVLAKATVRNYTRPSPLERRNIAFSAPYAAPPGQVRALAAEAARGAPAVALDPPPDTVVDGFGADGVQYVLRYYTTDHRGATRTDSMVRERLWHALARAGLAIPFPQREVRLAADDDGRRLRDQAAAREGRQGVLARVDLFRGLEPDVIAELADEAEEPSYAAGEVVVREGTAGDSLYVVRSGEVEVVVDGAVEPLATLGAGAFFGEMSLLTGERRNATVRARTETRLVAVGHAALQHALQRHPELGEKLSAVLAARQVQRDAHPAEAPVREREMVERSDALLSRIRAFFSD
jgi:small-conductance mechanosensitive channel/CRP-like cAMP-binding protein